MVYLGIPFNSLLVKKRVGQKLRRIILLYFGQASLSLHFPETQHVLIFMIFGFSGNVHDPHNHLFLILDQQNCPKVPRKPQVSFQIYY